MDSFINLSLIKNPVNWLVIGSMLAIYVFALHLVVTHFTVTTGGDKA